MEMSGGQSLCLALLIAIAVVAMGQIDDERYQIWAADLQPGFVIVQQVKNGQKCYCKVPMSTTTMTATPTTAPPTAPPATAPPAPPPTAPPTPLPTTAPPAPPPATDPPTGPPATPPPTEPPTIAPPTAPPATPPPTAPPTIAPPAPPPTTAPPAPPPTTAPPTPLPPTAPPAPPPTTAPPAPPPTTAPPTPLPTTAPPTPPPTTAPPTVPPTTAPPAPPPTTTAPPAPPPTSPPTSPPGTTPYCGPECNKTIIVDSPEFTAGTYEFYWTSPNYPSDYPDGCVCCLYIELVSWGSVEIGFHAGDEIHSSTNCEFDVLTFEGSWSTLNYICDASIATHTNYFDKFNDADHKYGLSCFIADPADGYLVKKGFNMTITINVI